MLFDAIEPAAAVSSSDITSSVEVSSAVSRFSGFSTGSVIFIAIAVFAALMIYLELLRSKYALTVTRRTVPFAALPKAFDGTKVVVLSDLHQMRFGEGNSELAKRIKREDPDYIFFVGDMGDSKKFNVDAFYDLLENLGDKTPIIAVPGNHDLRLGGGTVHKNFVREVERSGAAILNNTCAEMVSGGKKLYIYGFCQPLVPEENVPAKDWKFSEVTDDDIYSLLGRCPKDAPVILLAHDPRPFEQYSDWGADLVLSGHLHGGGICLPYLGGVFGKNGTFFPKYSAGLYQYNDSSMFVTRGLASPGLLRFLNPPEIAVLTLACKDSELLLEPEKPMIVMPKFFSDHEDIEPEEERSLPAASAKTTYRPKKDEEESGSAVKKWFANAGDWCSSEWRSLRDLLNERLNQLSDLLALMFGKKRSKFARAADENKKRNTYIAPSADKKKKVTPRYKK